MTFSPMAQISTSLILYLSCFVLPIFAQSTHMCNVEELLRHSSSDLVGYERLEKTLWGKSAEGAGIEYYYSTDTLKAIKTVYYGETGKLGFQYYFATPTTYLAKFAKYYYSAPITRPHSQITTIFKGEFVVCHGKVVRGIGDDVLVRYFESGRRILEDVLAVAPRR